MGIHAGKNSLGGSSRRFDSLIDNRSSPGLLNDRSSPGLFERSELLNSESEGAGTPRRSNKIHLGAFASIPDFPKDDTSYDGESSEERADSDDEDKSMVVFEKRQDLALSREVRRTCWMCAAFEEEQEPRVCDKNCGNAQQRTNTWKLMRM